MFHRRTSRPPWRTPFTGHGGLGRMGPWLAVALAACTPADQDKVVARVNGTAIVAREVDLAQQREAAAGAPLPDSRGARRHLVHALIVEELMAQQFRRTVPGSAEVDRSAINAARRDVLARHFVATLAARTPPPSCEEIQSYYQGNPLLFAQRRLFELRRLDVALPPAREAELRGRLAAASSLDELMAWLRRADLRFVMSQGETGSDEIPAALRTRLEDMEAGQVAVLPMGQGVQIIQLVGSRDAPLDEDSAWPLIARRLWLERQTAALEAEIRKLSRMAAISLPGEDGTPSRLPVAVSALDLGGRPEALPSCSTVAVKSPRRPQPNHQREAAK